MSRWVTMEEFKDVLTRTYDSSKRHYEFHIDDMLERVEADDVSYIESSYLPLIFKTHLPLFSRGTVLNAMISLCYGCGQDFQKGTTGLTLMGGGRMSIDESHRVLNEIIQRNLIIDYYDTPKKFFEQLEKIDRACDLSIVNALMRASHTRQNLLNNPDHKTTVSTSPLEGNGLPLQNFVLYDTKSTADLLMVDSITMPLWDYPRLFKERAIAPDNKNMSIVFMNFSMGGDMGANVIFADEHDFKNWLYYHRDILRKIVGDKHPDDIDTVGFAADLLEAIDESPNYNDFSSIAMALSAIKSGRIIFMDDDSNFTNKLKLMGSPFRFIKRFVNSGD